MVYPAEKPNLDEQLVRSMLGAAGAGMKAKEEKVI